MRLSTRTWLPGVLALAACGDPGNRIVVVAYDDSTRTYELAARQFDTLHDVRQLEGSVTTVLAGAEFIIDAHVAAAPSLEEALDRALREEGNAVKFSAVEGNDGWVSADYHSLAMASVYWNIERAAAFFQELGIAFDELGHIPTFYLVTFGVETEQGRVTLTDNAAYSLIPGLDGFLVLEQEMLDDLPLAMNFGVMVHEYGHAVMTRFRYGTPPSVDLGDLGGVCATSMIDEGTSDYFGAVATGDSNFIAWSAPFDRDLAAKRILSDDDAQRSVLTCGDLNTDPHEVGAKWASLLWAIGEQIDHQALAPVFVDALRDFAVAGSPTLATLPELLVARLTADDRVVACALIAERFAPVAGQVSSCP